MKLFLTIVLLEFASAVIIVAATRAYVLKSYSWTAVTEVLFVTQWFWARNISFVDDKSRCWHFGFPAYLIGAVSGTLGGLFFSTKLLGQ